MIAALRKYWRALYGVLPRGLRKALDVLLNPHQRLTRVRDRLRALWLHPSEARFIEHTKGTLSSRRGVTGRGEILVEVFGCSVAIAAGSYLTQYLAGSLNARIRAYHPRGRLWEERFFDRALSRVYRSFVDDVLYVRLTPAQVAELEFLVASVLQEIRTKSDLVKLHLDGIHVGDLLYDSLLMNYHVPTVDLQSPELPRSLRAGLTHWVFWKDYLENHDVRAVVISHTVYQQFATIARLALAKGISVFQANEDSIYRFSRERPDGYMEFVDYPEMLQRIPQEKREAGIREAARRLERRFSGEVGVDMAYSTRSAYGAIGSERVLAESNRKKVLISPHCFFDNPNCLRGHLFPDYYEWLEFLGRLSERTDYDWYIKTHADARPGNDEVIRMFLDRYPKFRMLPSTTSHRRIIADGIDVALTVYGTIGVEYPYLGIPVVNASPNNQRIRYGFNAHARTVQEYEDILLDLDRLQPVPSRETIPEFYYMMFMRRPDTWLIVDLQEKIRASGGANRCGPWGYDILLEQATPYRHAVIQETVRRFVESGEYFLSVEQIDEARAAVNAETERSGAAAG